jgi:hypothetical protein
MSRSAAALEKWWVIVGEQACSEQTVAEYCRRRGVGVSSLFAWKRRLRRGVFAVAAPTFVEAKVRPGDEVGGESQACIEIHLPGQRRILVRRGFDPAVLGEVVKTLEALA